MSQEPTPTQRKTAAWHDATRLVSDACGPNATAGDILAVANWLAAEGNPIPEAKRFEPEIPPENPPASQMVYDITLDGQKILDALKRRGDGQAPR